MAGNVSDWHGNVAERNRFGDFVEGRARHGIVFIDFCSLFGIPQPVRFEQVGPGTWLGKHAKTGEDIHLILMPPVLHGFASPAAHAPEVIELANDSNESTWWCPELR